MHIAFIGTAGRDKNKAYTPVLWQKMVASATQLVAEAQQEIEPWEPIIAVSGGAAWADHLAVEMYAMGKVSGLHLALPAPFINGRYDDRSKCGSTTNYYHQKFSAAVGEDSLYLLTQVLASGGSNMTFTEEPVSASFGAFFARNAKVAEMLDPEKDGMLAWTWGDGDVPADGGTKDTWDKFKSLRKIHIPLGGL